MENSKQENNLSMVDEQEDSNDNTDIQYGFHRASTDRRNEHARKFSKSLGRSLHSNEGRSRQDEKLISQKIKQQIYYAKGANNSTPQQSEDQTSKALLNRSKSSSSSSDSSLKMRRIQAKQKKDSCSIKSEKSFKNKPITITKEEQKLSYHDDRYKQSLKNFY